MSELTICLTAEGGERQIVKLQEASSVQDLFDQASQVYKDKQIESIRFGFPPKTLKVTENASSLLKEVGIQNQERMRVSFQQQQQQQQASKTRSKQQSSGKPSATPRGKSQRQAAKKATESFAETIKAQDELMKQQQQQTSKRKSPQKKSTTANRTSRTTSFPTATTGRRVQDGAVIQPKRQKRQQQQQQEPTTDPSLALLGALNDQSSSGRLIRKGWRQAVNDAYEQNQAIARLAAIASRKAQLTVQQQTTLQIIYPKGLQGRGNYEERVDYIPHAVLESVIAAIHPANPEALRPENLALLSPRVLWSLVYHTASSSVAEALQSIQPDLDWSFLRRRKQQLSAKALENLRQQQEQDSVDVQWEAAAAAIESVEQAMEQVNDFDRSQRQARILQAVQARQQVWNIETPSELDEEELKECIESVEAALDISTDALIQKLIKECSIHNWRELANVDAKNLAERLEMDVEQVDPWIDHAQQESLEEIMVEICEGNVEGVELLRSAAKSGTPKDLAAWRFIIDAVYDELTSATQQQPVPSKEVLQKWCDRAQQALDQLEWLSWYATPIE